MSTAVPISNFYVNYKKMRKTWKIAENDIAGYVYNDIYEGQSKITDHCVITFSFSYVHFWNLANIYSKHPCFTEWENWRNATFQFQLLSNKRTSLNDMRSRWQRCGFYCCKFSKPHFKMANKRLYLTFQLYQIECWDISTNV